MKRLKKAAVIASISITGIALAVGALYAFLPADCVLFR